ncbi:MAG: 2-C-methyl-D-erythritol 2,4-cyclodiphosphate synthase [Pseudohongiellaceae bacterium]
MRIGHGFDVHRFAKQHNPDKPLVLGGVKLPDAYSLEAHSDGDVIVHALCDAILGALGAGDIGQHFPDDDPAYAGISSIQLLKKVMEQMSKSAMNLVNADITLIAQVPKLAPHRDAIRNTLANTLQIPTTRLNIKATTTEGLGYLGRAEGIACHAVVLLGDN